MTDPGVPRCVVCRRRELADDEPQTCRPCIGRVKSTMLEAADLYPLLSVELRARVGAASVSSGQGGDDHPIPFGDLLSLMGPGAQVNCRDGQPDDAPSVVATLAGWEDDWRSTRGLPGAPTAATVTSCREFLAEHHGWAANRHPAFDEYAADMRDLLGRIKAALRLVDTPVRMGADCFECGEALVRDYDPPSPCAHAGEHRPSCDQGGLRDVARCVGCGRIYAPAQYGLAVVAKAQERCAQLHGEDCWVAGRGCRQQGARQAVEEASAA